MLPSILSLLLENSHPLLCKDSGYWIRRSLASSNELSSMQRSHVDKVYVPHCHTQPQSRTPRAMQLSRRETECHPMRPAAYFLSSFKLPRQETDIGFFQASHGCCQDPCLPYVMRHTLCSRVRVFVFSSEGLHHSDGDPVIPGDLRCPRVSPAILRILHFLPG